MSQLNHGPGSNNPLLGQMQQVDPHVTNVLAHAAYVGLYTMREKKDGEHEWEKASVEGALFLVQRSVGPKWQIVVRNQLANADDLIETPQHDWDLDVHPNYLLYRMGSGNIKGWWFHDDEDRKNILRELSRVLEEVQKNPKAQEVGDVFNVPHPGAGAVGPGPTHLDQARMGPMGPIPQDAQIRISKAKLRTVLLEMVGSDRFLDDLVARLRQ